MTFTVTLAAKANQNCIFFTTVLSVVDLADNKHVPRKRNYLPQNPTVTFSIATNKLHIFIVPQLS